LATPCQRDEVVPNSLHHEHVLLFTAVAPATFLYSLSQSSPVTSRGRTVRRTRLRMSAHQALAALRIGLGLEFIFWAGEKTTAGWLHDGSALAALLPGYLAEAQPAYASFLDSFVLPNVDVFAMLVALGEWTAG